jgi:hypothetical protein
VSSHAPDGVPKKPDSSIDDRGVYADGNAWLDRDQNKPKEKFGGNVVEFQHREVGRGRYGHDARRTLNQDRQGVRGVKNMEEARLAQL